MPTEWPPTRSQSAWRQKHQWVGSLCLQADGYADAELYLALAISCASLKRVPEAHGGLEQALKLNQMPEFKLKALDDLRLKEAWKAQA